MSETTTKDHPLIWYPPQPSLASRRPRLEDRGSNRGTMTNIPDWRELVYESGGERKVAYIAMARRDVRRLLDQPPPVSYRDQQGNLREHTFDFLLEMVDGSRIAVMVKPATKVQKKNSNALLRLIASQLPPDIDGALLMTEQSYGRNELHNAVLLHDCRREPTPWHDDIVRTIADGIQGRVAIRELVKATGLRADGFAAVVRAIGEGRLQLVDGGARIAYEALVEKPRETTRREATA
jgi:hypothetical protein